MSLEDVIDEFSRCDKRTFQVVACQRNEPSEADVAGFEGDVGFRLPEEFGEFEAEGFPDLVPFLQLVGDAGRYCFDAGGRILRWSHEEPVEREVEDAIFTGLLMREIRELEERKDRKIRG